VVILIDSFSVNLVDKVIKDGKLVVDNERLEQDRSAQIIAEKGAIPWKILKY